MRPLHAGVDTTVIALSLGHESVQTTQIKADLALKERALARTTPLTIQPGRYQPEDQLLAFLESERPARDRGFESLRFHHCDQHER
jgi:integrase/recombinase XerD